MTTLANLRQLLEMTPDGPARQRAGGTVVGVAEAYLPRTLHVRMFGGLTTSYRVLAAQFTTPGFTPASVTLDLTDPGTAHALLTALALALGMDPGPGALAVSWTRRTVGDAYILCTPTGNWLFDLIEPDPVRALEMAVAHVLGAS